MGSEQQRLRLVLRYASDLLSARELGELTDEHWSALEQAVQDALYPPEDARTDRLVVARDALERHVTPLHGQPYIHRCPRESFDKIVSMVANSKDPISTNQVRHGLGIAWSQVTTAFALFRKHGLVGPDSAKFVTPVDGFTAKANAAWKRARNE